MASRKNNRLLRIPGVKAKTGLGRSSIYNRIDPNSKYFDPDFPRPIQLSATGRGAVAWLEDAIDDWIESRIAL